MGKAAFFAPEQVTLPERELPPFISNFSILTNPCL
jgi:hypothetical protein